MMNSRSSRELTAAQTEFLGLLDRCALPLMAAPMFLVSGPDLVIACARAGVIGSYPAANARSIEVLDEWLRRTVEGIAKSLSVNRYTVDPSRRMRGVGARPWPSELNRGW
jgi:NAD(P)H-dependent flavin oxidoreductase YrpB (nitropropane dioxygenase family)